MMLAEVARVLKLHPQFIHGLCPRNNQNVEQPERKYSPCRTRARAHTHTHTHTHAYTLTQICPCAFWKWKESDGGMGEKTIGRFY